MTRPVHCIAFNDIRAALERRPEDGTDESYYLMAHARICALLAAAEGRP